MVIAMNEGSCFYSGTCQRCEGPSNSYRVLLNSGEEIAVPGVIKARLTQRDLVIVSGNGVIRFRRAKIHSAGCGLVPPPSSN
jgi:hypothetical protein